MRRRALLLTLLTALVAPPAAAQGPVETARALIARYHEDQAVLDRARDALETALARDRQVDTMILLSYVWYLVGDVRAQTADEKLAAYERGRELGKRAVELAPRNPDAHLWYAINTGRWGQTKGLFRSLFLVPTLREEIETILTLDPKSVRGHAMAANFYLDVPGPFGGDRAKSEEHFKKAIELDPRFTVVRVDYGRLLIAEKRWADARRELERVVNEREPRNVADHTVRALPRARTLLESIKDKK
jgi:tetratricopeptide (TPR) repeat protein